MIQTSRPVQVTDRATGDPAEAMRWQPGDTDACGAMLGWLFGNGVAFHHPSGHGPTTLLSLDDPAGSGHPAATAAPGDWIVRRGPTWSVTAAGDFDDELAEVGRG